MTYRNVMRSRGYSDYRSSGTARTSRSTGTNENSLQLQMCKDISDMLANTNTQYTKEIPPPHGLICDSIHIPNTNTPKMIHCIDSVARYQSEIRNYMQTFATQNIPSNLAWALCLRDPISIPKVLEDAYQEQFKHYLKSKNTDISKSNIELAFEIYQTTPHNDPAYAHYIASLIDSGNTRLVGEVCENLLRKHKHDLTYSLTSFKEDLQHWKQTGLNHLLLISAKYMTQYTDWKATSDFQDVLNHIHISGELPPDNIPDSHMVAGALEFIGYIGGLYEVQYKDDSKTVPEFIKTCLYNMENHVPKFLLTSANVKYKTWGFSNMSLQYKNGVLSLKTPEKLSIIDPTSTEKKITNNGNIFFKLGENLLSPEMTMLLQEPVCIQKILCSRMSSSIQLKTYKDISENLALLRHTNINNDLNTCIDLLYEGLHDTTKSTCIEYPQPLSVAAWKISLPTKVLKFNTLPRKYNYNEPHNVSRHHCADKSSIKGVSGIMISLRNKESIEAVIKNTLKSTFKPGITVTYEPDRYINTALHESIACFALHHAALHNIISLHQSVPWSNEHEDKRYAETQVAAKRSGRFRDWCGFVQHSNKNIHVSKLESHVITTSMIHQTFFPWLQYDNRNKFVQVLSSLPCESRFLPKNSNNKDASELQNLLQSVNNTFRHDVDWFPIRDPIHKIENEDVHVYTDNKANTIMYAYSSKNDLEKNVDFLMFKLLDY